MNKYVYVEMNDSVQVKEDAVHINDVATVYSPDAALCAGVKNIILYKFDTSCKKVISLLWLTSSVYARFPDCVVIPLGETDCIVERLTKPKNQQLMQILQKVKIALVSVLCLCGGAFSIMAFHNDISITNIFRQFYEFVTGDSSGGFTLLEISYSIGLLMGILVFYNHVGKKKLSAEPTPITVSMRNYERDMDDAIIKQCDREGTKIDVS